MLQVKKKLAKAQRSIQELRAVNEGIASAALEDKLSGLPAKQCIAVKTCFGTATRACPMTNCGECTLMRRKSPQLCKHVRTLEMLALPSKSCSDKQMQGFGPEVLSPLQEKTTEMDELSPHGFMN